MITGEKEITDVSNPNCSVDLTQGRRYFFRAACGNLKGFGAFLTSVPSSVVPSTWREIERKEQRLDLLMFCTNVQFYNNNCTNFD